LHPLTGVGPAGTSSGSRDPAAATAAATGSAECPGTTGTTVTAETTAMHVKLRVQEATCLAMPDGPPAIAAAQRYMDDHNLKDRLTHVLMNLLRERPDDPMKFLSAALCGDCGVDGKLTLDGKVSPDGKSPSSPSPRTEEEKGILRESIHVLPSCVRRGAPTRLLDFGSGETGFYSYEMLDDGRRLKVKSSKRKEAFFASFVEPWRPDAFCKALTEEFELQADTSSGALVFFAGATGMHREMLMSDSNGAECAQNFLCEVQQCLSSRFGGREAKIWLFVPSGLLEAQLELYATEWLVQHAKLVERSALEGRNLNDSGEIFPGMLVRDVFQQLDKNGNGRFTALDLKSIAANSNGKAKKLAGIASELASHKEKNGDRSDGMTLHDFETSLETSDDLQMAVQDIIFSGTLSAGGGSCQMAMMGDGTMPSLQLFTAPIGNRLPLVEGEFSKPVLAQERETWRGRIRAELSRANFPQGVRGLYVGIAAAFHAVKAVGLDGRVIDKKTVVAGLADTLEKLDPEDQRSISNLTLVQELIQWTFDEAACFVFKRNWKINADEFVATWSLGLFIQQYQALSTFESTSSRRSGRWKMARSRVLPPGPWWQQSTSPSCISADRLFEMPFIAWPLAPSYLLDIGSGEVGAYVYEADLLNGRVKVTRHTKIQDSFYEGFVVKDRVEDFATSIVQAFGIEPGLGRRHEVIAGGTTGLHREILLSDQEKRDQIFRFIGRVEEAITKQLGRTTVIRIFVPSGELEAQFELRGVEWLIGQASVDVSVGTVERWMIDKAFGLLLTADSSPNNLPDVDQTTSVEVEWVDARLKALGIHEAEVQAALRRADSDANRILDHEEFSLAVNAECALQAMVRRCCFSGTISAGGGSSQLTLTGCVRNGMAQMFSMPIGNRVPIVGRLFSTPATWEERADWVERIREGLRSSQFPKGVQGLFVGISAMYHAAKVAGVIERIVTKREAMKAFADALAQLDANADHRSIANLTLAQEIIRWVFDDDYSCMLFKRNWHANGTEYVASWTLGWYVTQFEGDAEVRERSSCNIQRISRGMRVRSQLRKFSGARLEPDMPAQPRAVRATSGPAALQTGPSLTAAAS